MALNLVSLVPGQVLSVVDVVVFWKNTTQ